MERNGFTYEILEEEEKKTAVEQSVGSSGSGKVVIPCVGSSGSNDTRVAVYSGGSSGSAIRAEVFVFPLVYVQAGAVTMEK